MRVVSFDVFDTLLVRVQARPADLFALLGAELKAAGINVPSPITFAQLRQQAELGARRTAPGGEVTLAEIYATLKVVFNWDAAICARVQAMEINLEEQSLKAVPGMLARVRAARESVDAIWFLSDMYLPAACIEAVLRREGFFCDGDRLFVSGEYRSSKHRGDLFAKVRAQAGAPITDWLHIGDNPHADDAVPRSQGIRTELLREAALNRYEELAGGKQTELPWRSLLAGAMRRARLANPETDPARRIIWDTGCDIVGPLVLGFVHWCLSEAKSRGVRRLYFVARDGQLPQRVASRLASAWGFDIECHYLHGSRQAWHPAAEQGADELRTQAVGYFRQAGLLNGTPWAMVDIGWHGNLQRSLGKLLALDGGTQPVTGFYFGLVPGASALGTDTVLGYWNQLPARDHGVRRLNHALWEIFLSADHGGVLGYREEAGRFEPVLREPRNQRALAWGMETLQAAVMKFAELWLEVVPKPPPTPTDWLAVAREVYLEFYQRPAFAEATVWGGIPFADGQVEQDFKCLTPSLDGPPWRGILPWQRPLYWWAEGAQAQEACWPLRLYLALRDAKRWLTD